MRKRLDEIIKTEYESARSKKNEAIQQVENYPQFVVAASLYKKAATALKSYIDENSENIDQAAFFLAVSEHEYHDCYYSYYIKTKELEKALAEAKKAEQIILIFKNILIKEYINSSNFETYNSEFEYMLNFNLVKQLEPFAKQYFNDREFEAALPFYKKMAVIIEGIDTTKIKDERLKFLRLNYVISQFNFSQCLYAIFRSLSKNDIFYLISGIKHLLKTIEIASEVAEISSDPHYREGLSILNKELKEIISGVSDKDILISEFKDSETFTDIFLDANPEYTRNQIQSKQSINHVIVFMVHGFNTRGEWKNDLAEILSADPDPTTKFISLAFDYGDFKFGKFINPRERNRVIELFHIYYNDKILRYSNLEAKVCIVCHSFGTYITSQNIKRFNEVYFDRIILLGSILRRKYNWQEHKNNNKIEIIRCELNKKDKALKVAYLYQLLVPWVRWLGNSGSKGFKNTYEFLKVIKNNYGDHSDMFGQLNMKNNWVPFLKS